VNGVPLVTTVAVNPAGGVQLSGGGSTVALADVGPDGKPLPASGGGLAGTPGGGLSVQATGFLAESQADVYMYSEQLWLGKATVDASGTVTMSLMIPSWVTPGGHTLQFVGYQGPYTSIALSTGITVAAPRSSPGAAPSTSGARTGYFRPGAVVLTNAAKARLWNAVNAPRRAAPARPCRAPRCTRSPEPQRIGRCGPSAMRASRGSSPEPDATPSSPAAATSPAPTCSSDDADSQLFRSIRLANRRRE
jgi:hypothetical protein